MSDKERKRITIAQVLRRYGGDSKTVEQLPQRYPLDNISAVPELGETLQASGGWQGLSGKQKARWFRKITRGLGMSSTHASGRFDRPRAEKRPR